ncbi:Hypothetical protein NTJ_00602 [Nesidiocoris tenuis]|uniref:Uncharacterized protein n=1 Tax=Nesidiocoris tenuis TaxID=355587 RepID=A0ABN7AA96_9HEMI|nr:Hypothetical protein NTJ_00602 [Nesidiocoris tenuis]
MGLLDYLRRLGYLLLLGTLLSLRALLILYETDAGLDRWSDFDERSYGQMSRRQVGDLRRWLGDYLMLLLTAVQEFPYIHVHRFNTAQVVIFNELIDSHTDRYRLFENLSDTDDIIG